MTRSALLASVLLACAALPAAAQDYFNILRPVDELEERLRDAPFRIIDWRGSRAPGDRTSRVAMAFADDSLVLVKWAVAPPGGTAFNNEPRFEVAAYELQKLFLDEAEYVVPPTLLRPVPIGVVKERMTDAQPTFSEAPGAVVVALQYWLVGVQPDGFWDPARADADSLYARHIGNFNILTYLVRHGDDNVGNFLISMDSANPRVFSVDNGVAFSSQPSDRGNTWRQLRVRRLPRATVERLRTISAADLEARLAVLAEFAIFGDGLGLVEAGENIAAGRGVRRSGNRIQFGLTRQEIRGVESRIRQILRQVDAGRIQLF